MASATSTRTAVTTILARPLLWMVALSVAISVWSLMSLPWRYILECRRAAFAALPMNTWCLSPPGSMGERSAPASPYVDGEEQEEPDDVDEVPVPGSRLEA